MLVRARVYQDWVRWMQEDCHESEANLVYTVKSCLHVVGGLGP